MSRIARICLLILAVFPVLSNAATYTFVTFDYPGSTGTGLSGINNTGQIVGSFGTASTFGQGFIRNADGSLIPIILPFQSPDTWAFGINSAGQVVGAFFNPTVDLQGYLRNTDGTYSIIADPLNPNDSRAQAINDAGLIVGSYFDPSVPSSSHGFLRDLGGTFTTIDDPNMASEGNQQFTDLSGINNFDQIVGTYTDAAGLHGFLRSPLGVFTTIDHPNAYAGTTSVDGINNLGIIVGRFIDSSGVHGFLGSTDGTSYTTIDYPGAAETVPLGINDVGDIVGAYRTSLTDIQLINFIAIPESSTVPEPASFALFLAGLAGIACFCRQQRT